MPFPRSRLIGVRLRKALARAKARRRLISARLTAPNPHFSGLRGSAAYLFLKKSRSRGDKSLNQLEFLSIRTQFWERQASKNLGENVQENRESCCPDHIILCIVISA